MTFSVICGSRVICSLTEQEAMLEFHALQDLKVGMFDIVDEEFRKVVLIDGKFVQEKSDGVH